MIEPRYDVAMVLTYYRPYVSGLSEMARMIAEGLVAKGRNVAVVCSRHDGTLAARETVNGVDVHRAQVLARVSKGTVSPSFLRLARRVASQSAVVHLHLPLLEAGVLARLVHRPLLATYQCDVVLGTGSVDRTVVRVLDASHRAALRRAAVVCPTSTEYLANSRMAAHVTDRRVVAIRPPFVDRGGGRPRLRRSAGLHVGFVGRLVTEKGIDVLLDAFARIPDPAARLLLAGEYRAVAGGSVVDELQQRIRRDRRVELLGFVPDDEMADFYASIDVLALPSVNALEAYGIVQLEAIAAGVPVVATDLPGVRRPVTELGLGILVPPGDHIALAAALVAAPARRTADAVEQARHRLLGSDPVAAYDVLVGELISHSTL